MIVPQNCKQTYTALLEKFNRIAEGCNHEESLPEETHQEVGRLFVQMERNLLHLPASDVEAHLLEQNSLADSILETLVSRTYV